ncbi:MAG: hypothetical protein COA78_12945 [Blastopirellula sp.]|nr:MAG: hypothetical protein COA78_12945 [Blastopirellula sp.]
MASRRKKSTDPTESLDLLLDTITNTFGGIVFIAILIVILLKKQDLPTDLAQPSVSTQAAVEREVLGLETTKQQLTSSLQSARTNFEQFVSDDLSSSLFQIAELENEKSRLIQSKQKSRQEINKSVSQSAELQTKLDSFKQQQSKLSLAIKKGELSLEKELETRTTTGTLPRERTTFKSSMIMIVKEGELFQFETRDGAILPGVNWTNFKETSLATCDIYWSTKNLSLSAKIGTGIPLSNAKKLDDLFSKFQPNRYFISIAIWGDSFKEFRLLKKSLVSQGFEYKLILRNPGERVSIGSSSQVPSVQ